MQGVHCPSGQAGKAGAAALGAEVPSFVLTEAALPVTKGAPSTSSEISSWCVHGEPCLPGPLAPHPPLTRPSSSSQAQPPLGVGLHAEHPHESCSRYRAALGPAQPATVHPQVQKVARSWLRSGHVIPLQPVGCAERGSGEFSGSHVPRGSFCVLAPGAAPWPAP